MKIILSFILLWVTEYSLGQQWYSRTFDPFNGNQEVASIMTKDDDTLIIRAATPCFSDSILCSMIGKYSIHERKFVNIAHFDEIQTGGKNLIETSNRLLLSSQESVLNQNVSISEVDKITLDYISTLKLKIYDDRYSDYTIKKSIRFNDKIIVTAQVLDRENFIGYPGWNNYQEVAVFFVLDSILSLDTTFIITPSSGAFLKVEDLALGPDSNLYISFYEKYLKSGPSVDFLENRKVVYGINKEYDTVFEWIGPEFSILESHSNIVVTTDTNIYINYTRNFRPYVASIQKNGSTKWESILDSTIGENIYSINNLILAGNGDLLGVGSISSVIAELGQSGFLFRMDSNGVLKWMKAIRINKGFDLTVPPEFPFQSALEDLEELSNGDLISVGYVRAYVGDKSPNGPLNFDIWIVQTNSNGCLWNDCPFIQDIITKNAYIPLVYPGNEWVVDAISVSLPASIHRYSFSQDSVLLNENYYYKLIYKQTIEGPWQETGRLLREVNGKVFEYNYVDTSEILLYDFDFQIGDTLLSHVDGSTNRRTVIKVESVKLLDDVPRKLLMIECTSDQLPTDTSTWIEGMGDIERLLWTKTFCSTNDSNDSMSVIRCFLTDKQVYYSRPEIEGCYLTFVENLDIGFIDVFPNPSSDILRFDMDIDLIVDKVIIYNSLSQIVLTSDLNNGFVLDITKLPAGIYFGLISFENKLLKRFKTIVVR